MVAKKTTTSSTKTLADSPSSSAEASPKPVDAQVLPTEEAVLSRGDLLERVKASASGVNGQVASAIMDIVLAELTDALRAEKKIKALPLGNLIVQKRKVLEDGEVLVCKFRVKDPKPAPDPFEENSGNV